MSPTLDRIGSESHPYWNCAALEYSPDGQSIAAVCGKNHELKMMVFDSSTGEKLREADFPAADSEKYKENFYGYLADLAYSSDGRLIAFAGFDIVERATVWDANELTLLELPNVDEGVDAAETAIAFSPDNQFIAIGNVAGRIGIFDSVTRDQLALIENPEIRFPITALSFSPNGELLLAAIRTQEASAVRIWAWKSGQEWATISHGSLVVDIVIHRDTQRLYTLAAGNEVRVWETLSTPKLVEGGVEQSSAEKTMPVLVSVLCGASMAVNFDPVTAVSCLFAPDSLGGIKGGRAVPRIALAPDGERLAIVDNRATKGMGSDRIMMFDAMTLEKRWTATAARSGFDSLFAWAHDIAYSPDGKFVAVAGGGIRLFDAETGEERIPSAAVAP